MPRAFHPCVQIYDYPQSNPVGWTVITGQSTAGAPWICLPAQFYPQETRLAFLRASLSVNALSGHSQEMSLKNSHLLLTKALIQIHSEELGSNFHSVFLRLMKLNGVETRHNVFVFFCLVDELWVVYDYPNPWLCTIPAELTEVPQSSKACQEVWMHHSVRNIKTVLGWP